MSTVHHIEQAKENIYTHIRQLARLHVTTCKRAARRLDLDDDMDSCSLETMGDLVSSLEERRQFKSKRSELLRTVEQSFDETFKAFYDLLWCRQADDSLGILKDLDTVIYSPGFKKQEGLDFINRYFYSVCNLWHTYPALAKHVVRLIQHLDELKVTAISREKRILQERVCAFRQSPQAKVLRRQVRFHETDENVTQKDEIGDYLPNLFYLYRSTTRTQDIAKLEELNLHKNIGLARKQQRKLIHDYKSVVDYHNRRDKGETNLTVPIKGWSTPEFEENLKYYYPLAGDSFGLRAESIKKKLVSSASANMYSSVHNYVMRPCHPLPAAVRNRFKRGLYSTLKPLKEGNYVPDSTVIAVFKRTLQNFLLPTFERKSVDRLRENVQKAGAKGIVSVILSIVLACPMVRFELEKMLGFLYEWFETSKAAAEQWLIDFFQHMNLALVANAKALRYI